MLYVVASPDLMTAAATNLAEIGSAISTANGAAALPTVEVVAAAADEVSTQIAALFGAHARSYQTLSTQAAAFHSRFVQALTTAAASYASVEAANASPLQVALDVINAPAQTLLGRPLIGNGADGSTPGQAGGPGGLLYGNGAGTEATARCWSATVAPAAPVGQPRFPQSRYPSPAPAAPGVTAARPG